MKALSIRQPWAWLIVNGYKTVENRRWPTKYRGKILIHASKTPDSIDEIRRIFRRETGLVIPRDLPMGGIVGEAEITGCVTESRDDWFLGPYGFTLSEARPLPFRPCAGKLGIFELNNGHPNR